MLIHGSGMSLIRISWATYRWSWLIQQFRGLCDSILARITIHTAMLTSFPPEILMIFRFWAILQPVLYFPSERLAKPYQILSRFIDSLSTRLFRVLYLFHDYRLESLSWHIQGFRRLLGSRPDSDVKYKDTVFLRYTPVYNLLIGSDLFSKNLRLFYIYLHSSVFLFSSLFGTHSY
jgi:hypothetical protein